MQVLDENPTNYLVQTKNGVETKAKSSPLNQLLFGQGLHEFLIEGTEIWTKGDVTIVPGDNAEQYTLHVGNDCPITLDASKKTDLVDKLQTYYEQDSDDVTPILDLYHDVREEMIRPEVLSPFLDLFDPVEERDDGWFINGHLLLTYDGEFHHPETQSRKRSGQQVLGAGSAAVAYSGVISAPTDDISRTITVGGEKRLLTDKEVEFIARLVWAIENTPDQR